MKLTIFNQGVRISFEIKSFNHYGKGFFVFSADLTFDLVDYLSETGLIYTQPTSGTYQLSKKIEFSLE